MKLFTPFMHLNDARIYDDNDYIYVSLITLTKIKQIMQFRMKKILLIALALIGLLSCQNVDKVPYVWQGEKEISAEGGTVEWTPSKEDVRVEPTIVAVYTLLYDLEEKEAQTTKIDNPGQTVEGEWFKIEAKRNSVAITFLPNDTGYSREVQVGFEDGLPGGHSIIIIQRAQAH